MKYSVAIVVVVTEFYFSCPFTFTVLMDTLGLQCFVFEISNSLKDIKRSNN